MQWASACGRPYPGRHRRVRRVPGLTDRRVQIAPERELLVVLEVRDLAPEGTVLGLGRGGQRERGHHDRARLRRVQIRCGDLDGEFRRQRRTVVTPALANPYRRRGGRLRRGGPNPPP